MIDLFLSLFIRLLRPKTAGYPVIKKRLQFTLSDFTLESVIKAKDGPIKY